MSVTPILLLIVPVFSTLAGGLLALRFRRSMIMLVALGAGLLLGAAFLDLLPEAIALGSNVGLGPENVLGITLLSFFAFLGIQGALDKLSDRLNSKSKPHKALGRIGGSMLIFHSLRDGMAIGLSYAASHPAGFAVAIGIAADCIAPLAGGLLTMWWVFSLNSSVVLLAVASGFFIQMATSDFLPEIRHGVGPRRFLILLVLFGAAMIYGANLLMGRLH
jgi:zinc and cadmium transporter